jgi:hypothetical protein
VIRSILSVVAGYTTLALLIMAGFSVGFARPDLAFEPGTLNVTPGWLIYTTLLSFATAIVGGWVCRRIARSHRPVQFFAALVFVIGMASAIQNNAKPVPTLTADELNAMPQMERMQHTRQPDWFAFTIPVLAAAGILVGGSRRRAAETQ